MIERILIIIPAFNAAETIRPLITSIKNQVIGVSYVIDILVINDGSRDETAAVTRSLGIRLVSHEYNQGKGAALQTGLEIAVSEKYTAVITIDADLQHDPGEIPKMVKIFYENGYDVLIAAREISLSAMPLTRFFSNSITTALLRFKTGISFKDSQSGYRMIRVKCLSEITLRSSHFETESELLILLARRGTRFGFLPVQTIYRGERSNIRHVRDTIRFIRMYFKT